MISDGRSAMFPTDQTVSLDPLENQLCRVCEEKAAGFHFGAFTCEGCKSFFGRFCNNQTSIPDCKNSYRCVVDKRNRTACKACRLRKCLAVGMSKSGCRYGRRSNWFKIHCLMQKNSTQADRVSPAAGHLLPMVARHAPPAPPPPASLSPLSSSDSRTPSPRLNVSLSDSVKSESSCSSSSTSSTSPPPIVHPQATFPHLPHLPLLDPLTLYRLSPLLALSPYLPLASPVPQQTSPVESNNFQEQLRLLAERRALFEATCALARTTSASAFLSRGAPEESLLAPIDLSVK